MALSTNTNTNTNTRDAQTAARGLSTKAQALADTLGNPVAARLPQPRLLPLLRRAIVVAESKILRPG
jgi:hypothetical protein